MNREELEVVRQHVEIETLRRELAEAQMDLQKGKADRAHDAKIADLCIEQRNRDTAAERERAERAEAASASAAREVNHRMLIARLEDQIEQIATLRWQRDSLRSECDVLALAICPDGSIVETPELREVCAEYRKTIRQLRNELNQALLERDGMEASCAAMREALEWIRRTSAGVPDQLGCDSQGNCSMRDCDCSNHTARRILDSTTAGAGLLERLRDAEEENQIVWTHGRECGALEAGKRIKELELERDQARADAAQFALDLHNRRHDTELERNELAIPAATGPRTRVAASETNSASQVEQAQERATGVKSTAVASNPGAGSDWDHADDCPAVGPIHYDGDCNCGEKNRR